MDKLAGMEMFVRVVECGSFAAAAEELHRVPSAMIYAVQKLEQDLGVSIFDRRGHRAKLTPVGQALLRDRKSVV